MKKSLFLSVLILSASFLFSCKKDTTIATTLPDNQAKPDTVIVAARLATAEDLKLFKNIQRKQASFATNDAQAAKCTTKIYATGLGYSIEPISVNGRLLLIEVPYINTAPNGVFNFFFRKQINPYPRVWAVQGVQPPLTVGTPNTLSYVIVVPNSWEMGWYEFAAQGVPGTTGCPTDIDRTQIEL